MPPGQVWATDCALEVTGEEHQLPLRVLRLPATSGIMPVSGRNECVEQHRFHRRPVGQGRAAQLRRVRQGSGRLSKPGVVDGTGQADHQRRGQGLPGRCLSTEHGENRGPSGSRDRAGRVITEVTAYGVVIQRAQLDSRCRPEGHLDTTLWPNRVSVLLGTAGDHNLFAGPDRVVDPADRGATDLFGDLIEPIHDRQDQPGSQQRGGPGRLLPARRRGARPGPGGLARAGWSITSWAPSQPRRSWAAGFQDATEARNGTGAPSARRASRSSTRRTISIVLPAPGSPSTTSRPVGTRASTSTSLLPFPARPAGPLTQGRLGGGGHPAPLVASFTSESQESVRDASAAAQETGSG